MDLVVIGLSHRTAPVALRERLALVPSELETRLQRLIGLPGITEAVMISTCNRVEIIAVASPMEEGLSVLREHLREQAIGGRSPGPADDDPSLDIDRHLYERLGREALHHLLRVTSSLDSLVVGEPQILGQVKDAFDAALSARTVGPLLGFVFQRAFRIARRVRRDTGIARQTTSISSVAVELARQVWSGFEGKRVLLVGAGKMADLAARSLRASGATIAVTNRTASRAEELAKRLGCTTEPWDDLTGALARADIVISSTGAREPIVRVPMMTEVQRRRRRREIVLIDIAVPRDIDPDVGKIGGVFLVDIDDLQKIADQHMDGRRQEAERAEALVEEELARCLAAHRGRGVGPTITALRSRYLGVARTEAEKTASALAGSDERVRRALFAMADAIAGKLLHAPQVALKRGVSTDEGEALLAAAHALFDLPPVEAVESVDGDGDAEAAEPPEKKAVQT